MEVGDGGSFLRQLSHGGGGGGWEHSSSIASSYYLSSSNGHGGSKRWGRGKKAKRMEEGGRGGGLEGGGGMMAVKKRVMVVIDQSSRAKHAMMWALTHVANKGDLLTLLHVVPSHSNASSTHRTDDIPQLANSLGSLCKACKPEVEVEALVIQGPKLGTVLSQVKKLEASVLVLSQGKPSPICCLFRSNSEEFVEQCINQAECLTLAVKKQSNGVGGYLVSTRWQKNFWLLA
ncbi:Adenine nucleotide alpha hydrolases-like protein [Dioscorea alata]|uniref:Adenine nucleotide alpha hydrolases-like protein n=1 Tax=Dioscorea alata TaxID=55571 RepID=A0ACB7WC18_DIOAL|nr:Adenine nucleotide alpha hydrolases-like protein [Dioscorea alata]